MVQRGEYTEALEFGKSIEERYTEDHDFLFIMGSIYYILEEPARALPYFESAITFQHDDIEALMLKTNVHLALKQPQEAVLCCMQILKIDSEHEEAKSLLSQLSD
jgi:tetratricopeptide (TPR) repeat protein